MVLIEPVPATAGERQRKSILNPLEINKSDKSDEDPLYQARVYFHRYLYFTAFCKYDKIERLCISLIARSVLKVGNMT